MNAIAGMCPSGRTLCSLRNQVEQQPNLPSERTATYYLLRYLGMLTKARMHSQVPKLRLTRNKGESSTAPSFGFSLALNCTSRKTGFSATTIHHANGRTSESVYGAAALVCEAPDGAVMRG